jgi:hypothetical protein
LTANGIELRFYRVAIERPEHGASIMSKDTKPTARIQQYKPQTDEGIKGALAFCKELAKEGMFNSYEEFRDTYLVPYAANRLLALARYEEKQGKKLKVAKKGAKVSK